MALPVIRTPISGYLKVSNTHDLLPKRFQGVVRKRLPLLTYLKNKDAKATFTVFTFSLLPNEASKLSAMGIRGVGITNGIRG